MKAVQLAAAMAATAAPLHTSKRSATAVRRALGLVRTSSAVDAAQAPSPTAATASPSPHEVAAPSISRREPSGGRVVVAAAGQAAQRVGMLRDVAAAFPLARRMVSFVDDALGYPLSQLMFNGPETLLNQTQHAQPAVLCHAVVALTLLEQHGVLATPYAPLAEMYQEADFVTRMPRVRMRPNEPLSASALASEPSRHMLLGHSIGELACLVAARCLSFESALKLAVRPNSLSRACARVL